MRFLVFLILVWSLVAGPCPSVAFAQKTDVPAEHHPWGRFEPGAWKLVRVLTETLDENGIVTSTSSHDTKFTLMSVDEDGVTLKVEGRFETAGQPFELEPKIIKQGFHGEQICEGMKIMEPSAGTVTIEGRKIPCKILHLECPGPTNNTVTSVYYSADTAPYILKRESVTSDHEGKNTLGKTTFEVMALDMPQKIVAEIKSSALVKAVNKHSKGTTTTVAWTSTEMPGGIISHSSKEVDQSGRLIRRSTLELLAYGLVPDEDWQGPLGVRRRARLRRYVPR